LGAQDGQHSYLAVIKYEGLHDGGIIA
jgi:hypothetical protein